MPSDLESQTAVPKTAHPPISKSAGNLTAQIPNHGSLEAQGINVTVIELTYPHRRQTKASAVLGY